MRARLGQPVRLALPARAQQVETVAVLIPAYNEAEHLTRVLPRVPRAARGYQICPVVISDGSTDGTGVVAERLGADCIELSENRGKGAALAAGLKRLGDYDVLVLMDADGQHRPEDIPRLIQPIRAGQADVVMASRYLGRPGRGVAPRNRYLVRRVTVRLLERWLGQTFTDPYCGFRAFSRRAARRVLHTGRHYEGELATLFAAVAAGMRIVEVPIDKIYGPGLSKMGARHGRLLGRLEVILQYAVAMRRARKTFT